MPRTADAVLRLAREGVGWPPHLRMLGDSQPPELSLLGHPELLDLPLTALFCSGRLPGELVVRAYELAETLAAQGTPVIGGFQSPLEKEMFDLLLNGCGPVVFCPARGLAGMAIRVGWREALARGRLLLVSPFPARIIRPTTRLSHLRNRVVAALATRVVMAHASPGGGLARLACELSARGTPLYCLDHPANADLRLLGALPLSPGGVGGSAGDAPTNPADAAG